jgi:deoxycytidylate deaminase
MTTENSRQSELFFALITPAGVRRDEIIEGLIRGLKSVDYEVITVKLSDLLPHCPKVWKAQAVPGQGQRVIHLQAIGNEFRKRINKDQGDGAALARAAITAIRENRLQKTGSPDMPAQRTAYVLDQLKNPQEVELLREVYGSCFFLIAGHAANSSRSSNLAEELAKKEGQPGKGSEYQSIASEIIKNDDIQEDGLEQNTRDTYPKADVFVDLETIGNAGPEIARFIELIFGHPFHTPRIDEYAMYQANAASLRSSDESRQVGAAVATDKGDVIAVGTNEVPVRGGGLYWPGESPDMRDQQLASRDEDRAKEIKIRALRELLERLSNQKKLPAKDVKAILDQPADLLKSLKGTQFAGLGEFGRTVHAEMAALIDAAKRGVSVDRRIMHVTTFPCHNCAKHIIASGIKKVVYLEPYPKSEAHYLHGEEIELNPKQGTHYKKDHNKEEILTDRVIFVRYSGIAPRQYQQLFTMTSRGAKKGYPLKEWNSKRTTTLPRNVGRNAYQAYLAAERQELETLLVEDFKWDKKRICP